MSRRPPHTLVVRLDALGDMIICGPAIRAVAAGSRRVTVLAGPQGAPAARLLPGVDEVVEFACPWILADPPPVDAGLIADVVDRIRALDVDAAVVLTSFHQSALPTALLLRLAGVHFVAAVSEDYPGSLLDVRIPPPPDAPEPVRMLAVAAAAGYPLPVADDGRLALAAGGAGSGFRIAEPPYVVLHPGACAPARTYPIEHWRRVAELLVARGERVVVTGGPDESELTAAVAGGHDPARVIDLAGRVDLAGLCDVLRAADAVVVANTGPAHLAAAVDTPVVSLFAPVVPAVRWAPYGSRVTVLGDLEAPCRNTRARLCPVPGHPCLANVTPEQVVNALDQVRGRRPARPEVVPA